MLAKLYGALCMYPSALFDYNFTFVHSRVDSSTFILGNPLSEST